MVGMDRCRMKYTVMEKKLKILYVVEAFGGGVFTYLSELCNELINKYDIYIAYGIRSETPNNFQEYFDSKIHFYHVENFCRELNITKDISAIRELKDIAMEVNPDIIHLHSSKAGAIGRIAFSGKKVALFYTPHGYSFLMQNCNIGKRGIYWLAEVILAKRKCITICCGAGEYIEAKKIAKHVTVVNNGINIEEMQDILAQDRKVERKQFTVFTLGRICQQKNPMLFNEIAEQLKDVRFIWVGDGELRESLNAHNIEITGWLSRCEALRIANDADLFILTSEWEGMPLSIIEAMYMRKVCVISDISGNREIIKNKQNGYLCKTLPEYVEIIKEVKDKDNEEMCEMAYREVINKYNTKIMGMSYSQIYENA